MTFNNSSDFNIEEKKLNQMKLKILKLEQKNLKNSEKSKDEMIETIRRIISDEVKKNY